VGKGDRTVGEVGRPAPSEPGLSCRTGGCREDPAEEEGDRTMGEVGRPAPSEPGLSCRTGGWREDPADVESRARNLKKK
jgi:hypothetical protein